MSILKTRFVLIAAVTILVLVFLETTLVLVTLETNPVLTMTLETNPVLTLILETSCVLKLTFKEMTKLPPGSSSSFSLASVVVVRPHENQCRDVKQLVWQSTTCLSHLNSPETKRLMENAIANGASVRTAYKTVRKRLRIEARPQKELDGVEPEVVPDSFSQSGESGAAPAVWTVEESVDSSRHSCKTSSCEG